MIEQGTPSGDASQEMESRGPQYLAHDTIGLQAEAAMTPVEEQQELWSGMAPGQTVDTRAVTEAIPETMKAADIGRKTEGRFFIGDGLAE